MHDSTYLKTVTAAAVTALLLGAGTALTTLRRLRLDMERIERKTGQLEQLYRLEEDIVEYRQAWAAFVDLPAQPRATLAPRMEGGPDADLTAKPPRELPASESGWVRRRQTLIFADPPGSIGAALRLALHIEQNGREPGMPPRRPPWRLAGALIESSREPGTGTVSLTFETLQPTVPDS